MRIRDWRIPFCVLLVCGFCEWTWASCPILTHSDQAEEREFQNLCQQITNPIINFGTASTLTVTSSVTLQGVADGSDAAEGKIGQYIEGIGGTVNATGNGQYVDAVSIPLTAGDWDVTGMYRSDINTATWSESSIGISTTTGNSAIGLVEGSSRLVGNWANSATTPAVWAPVLSTYRMSLSTSKTIYLKARFSYSAGTPQVTGSRLSARRVH